MKQRNYGLDLLRMAAIDCVRSRLFRMLKLRQRLLALEEKWLGDVW